MSEDQERGFVIRDKRGGTDPAPASSSAPFGGDPTYRSTPGFKSYV